MYIHVVNFLSTLKMSSGSQHPFSFIGVCNSSHSEFKVEAVIQKQSNGKPVRCLMFTLQSQILTHGQCKKNCASLHHIVSHSGSIQHPYGFFPKSVFLSCFPVKVLKIIILQNLYHRIILELPFPVGVPNILIKSNKICVKKLGKSGSEITYYSSSYYI